MTRVQVILPVEERERFRLQAQSEGLSLSAWFRAAARDRVARARRGIQIRTPEELEEFFRQCDQREAGQGPEPDWDGHLAVMEESRKRGASGT